MRRIVGALFVFMLVLSIVVLPAPVSAGFGKDCTYDSVKWEKNQNSWNIYLKHWGKTPMTAMSRLAGLCGPDALCQQCNSSGLCNKKRITGCDIPIREGACACAGSGSSGCCFPDETCKNCATPIATAKGSCWGASLAFANKSWGACDISTKPRLNNSHPNHFGNSEGGAKSNGGDWGISGCQHAECVAATWCLAGNLCPKPTTTTAAK